MTRTTAETREIEPLTNDEAEAAFITLVTVLGKMGCTPAASVTSKEDEGVSFSLHFSADRARKLIANANHRTTAEPLADGEMIEKVARAICGASCVGNQKPDDMMGVLFTSSGTEGTRPFRWETCLPVARAAIAAYNPNDRLREADDIVLVAIPNPKKISGFSNDGTPMYEVKRSQIFAREALSHKD